MNARLRFRPLTVVKLPVATSRVPFGETAMWLTLVSLFVSTTPETVMAIAPVFAAVVGFSASTRPAEFPAAMTTPLASSRSDTVR